MHHPHKRANVAYDAARQRLHWQYGTQDCHLSAKMAKTLLALANAPQQQLSRDALRLAVWGHLSVSDDTLNHTLFRLRKTLVEQHIKGIEILTLSRGGYRLISRTSRWREYLKKGLVILSCFAL